MNSHSPHWLELRTPTLGGDDTTMKQRWPVILDDRELRMQPLRLRDWPQWSATRARNREWLAPWNATTPRPDLERPPAFPDMVRRINNQARAGTSLPWALWLRDGGQAQFIGQVTVSGIVGGAARLCHIGYWIDSAVAGRGYMPRAVALATHYVLTKLDLHRVEIAIRPENSASVRVVTKLGFDYEGRRPAFLHIDGDWRDHDVFTVTNERLDDPNHPLRVMWSQQGLTRPTQR